MSRPQARRVMFALLVGALIWLGREFTEEADPSLWYTLQVGPLPGQYALLAAILILFLPAAVAAPPISFEELLHRRRMLLWTALAGVAIIIAVAIAVAIPPPFAAADWRNFAVFAVVCYLLTRWLSSQPWRHWALLDVAIVYGLFALYPLGQWIAGGGYTVMQVRVPIFSGVSLQLASFAAIMTFAAWVCRASPSHPGYRSLLRVACAASSLLVLLSIRRTYWLIWTIGVVVVLIYAYRHGHLPKKRLVQGTLLLLAAMAVATATMGGDLLLERVESFHPNAQNQFSGNNDDHVGDVLDAMDVIMEEPVLGLGIGRVYQTDRIRYWKRESFEVHNAYVHAWLKFGFLGLVAFTGFHIRWSLGLLRGIGERRDAIPLAVAAGAFLLGQLFAFLASPWPYSRTQLMLHHAVMLAVFLSGHELHHEDASPAGGPPAPRPARA